MFARIVINHETLSARFGNIYLVNGSTDRYSRDNVFVRVMFWECARLGSTRQPQRFGPVKGQGFRNADE